MGGSLYWLLGRGASIACNLTWSVPESWKAMPRDEKISRIKEAILSEMNSDKINTEPYKKLLHKIQKRTNKNWRHYFGTTNWDCLLRKEIDNLNLKVEPEWLDGHVFHVNGTVENYPNQDFGSPFLLEEDKWQDRYSTPEADMIFNHIAWGRRFIVIGMSFECETDRFLLSMLNKVQDDLPVGESIWIVLNPDKDALEKSSSEIATALPRSKVYTKPIGFNEWIDEGMHPLVELGILMSKENKIIISSK